jgi:hypothetical protein
VRSLAGCNTNSEGGGGTLDKRSRYSAPSGIQASQLLEACQRCCRAAVRKQLASTALQLGALGSE